MNTLDQLPFELLPLILDHVQRKDLLTCTLINRRFYRAALPLLWRELDIRSHKVRDMIITILSTSSSAPGHHVRLLDKSVFCPFSDAHLLAIIKHVPYLEKLVLRVAHPISDTSLQQVPSYCPHLTSIYLNCRSHFGDSLEITDASMIAFAQHCHQLTHLTFINMHRITNASMLALGQHCHQLTHLTLRYMPSLDYATLLDHLHNCPLTHIEIFSPRMEPAERQPFVGRPTLGVHRHHQQALPLQFIDRPGDDILTTIHTQQIVWPHLTSFHVTGCSTLTDAMATTFMQTHPKLQQLTLQGSDYLTNHFLVNVIQLLPHLQSLNVAHNPQLTASGICRLIKHYNGQLVGEIDCSGYDIYTDDDDFPEDLDCNGYEKVYDEDDNNPEMACFYADAFT